MEDQLVGRLETPEGGVIVDAIVEIWRPDWPTDLIPLDVPYDRLDGYPRPASERIESALLARGRTDANGGFDLDLSDPAEEVFVRAFRGDQFLASSDAPVPNDGRVVLTMSLDSESGRSWTVPKAAGAAAVFVAAAWYLTQGNSPGATTDSSPGATPTPTPASTADGDRTDEAADETQGGRQLAVPEPSGMPPRTVGGQGEFLYTGDDPLQTGVDTDAIDESRAAILRGRVRSRAGDPLPGVTVRVQNRPEFGETTTRDTGQFDMVVSGGGTMTIALEKQGWLPAQRKRTVSPQEYVQVGDIALVEASGEPTTVELDSSQAQVARGGEIQDSDGTRQATIIVPPGTTATVGEENPTRAEQLSLQMTEYSVGENGQAAMPGELPSGTGYTYAVELSGESDDGDGGGELSRPLATAPTDVTFDSPVVFYVENFLGFDVGEAVPTGLFDRDRAAWESADDGRVIEITAVEDGRARIDTGGPASVGGSAPTITEAERRQLGEIYSPGTTLWRVPVPHFTPVDCNWPIIPPDGAGPPPLTEDEIPDGFLSEDEGEC
jgi:hypothetical protein